MITLYHGSDIEIKEIDLSQSRINKDFGRGFYLSSDLDQARNFAKYKADNPESKTKTQVVTKFETDEATFTDGTLRIKRFDGYTLEWAQFIKENRKTRNTDYDIVIGPIANDDVKTQFARHLPILLHQRRSHQKTQSNRNSMKYNKNQIGRILLQRLVEGTGCDMQVAVRFFYNSDFYASLPSEPIEGDIDTMYSNLLQEYQSGAK